jgi:hypothetical protein
VTGASTPDAAAGPMTTVAAANATPLSAGDWQVTGSAGFRHEWIIGDPHVLMHGPDAGHTDSTDWQYWHADMDLAFSMGSQDSLDIRIDGQIHRRWNVSINPIAPDDYYIYTRSGIAMTWAHGTRLNISGVLRYDTFYYAQGKQTALIDGAGNLQTAPYPTIYPAGEIRYMFLPGSTLRLFGGMTPGGRLCTGGVCRDVPPFQGAILELVVRI